MCFGVVCQVFKSHKNTVCQIILEGLGQLRMPSHLFDLNNNKVNL